MNSIQSGWIGPLIATVLFAAWSTLVGAPTTGPLGRQQFKAPFDGDAVLYLKAQL